MNNDRDPELDQLLGPLMNQNPSAFEVRRWQRAVLPLRPRKWQLQLAAAALIGLIVGAAAMKLTTREESLGNISYVGATFESTHTNLD